MQIYTLATSCDACIRSKKKCDKNSPRCGRCAARRIDCKYQNESLAVHRLRATPQRVQDPESPGRFASRLHTFHLSQPVEQQFAPFTTLSHTTLPEPEMVFSLGADSLNFMVNSLKSFPIMAVENGGMPMCHAQLYQFVEPSVVVRKAHRTLRENLAELKDNEEVRHEILAPVIQTATDALPSFVSFADVLGFVQVLIVIQILTLFSNNLTPRQKQEADERQKLLTYWSSKLWATAPAELPSYLTPCQAYIFAESVRRTMLVVSEVHAVYQVMRTGTFVHNAFIAALPFGADTEIWETCNENPGCREQIANAELISYRELTNRWSEGKVKKATLFEKMLRVECQGRAAVEASLTEYAGNAQTAEAT